jgi:hypothetical protein
MKGNGLAANFVFCCVIWEIILRDSWGRYFAWSGVVVVDSNRSNRLTR